MKTRSTKTKMFAEIKRLKRASKEKSSKKKKHLASTTNRVTRKPKTTFTDLNDDCVEEILRRLPAVELCKFTVLNKRLKTIAEEMFKRLYSMKTITFKPTETCATEFGSKITRYPVKLIDNLFRINIFVRKVTNYVLNMFQVIYEIIWFLYATNSSDWNGEFN